MTKEQTISNLKKLKSFHNGSYGADIDRAIKALEQEPKTGHQKSCDTCEYSDEIDGSNCYECVKGMKNNYTPQEPKTGHWIEYDHGLNAKYYQCSICKGFDGGAKGKYCKWCGAKMVEPQETETWNGYHGQITAPKGTFERIFNDADDDNDI